MKDVLRTAPLHEHIPNLSGPLEDLTAEEALALFESLSPSVGAELARRLPAQLITNEVIERLLGEPRALSMLALNPALDQAAASRTHGILVNRMAVAAKDAEPTPDHLLGTVDLLTSRGFPIPGPVMEGILSWASAPSTPLDVRLRLIIEVLLELPGDVVDDPTLARLWDQAPYNLDLSAHLRAHTAAGTESWRRAAGHACMEWEKGDVNSRLVALDTLHWLSQTDAVRDPVVNPLLLGSEVEDVMARALPYADPQDFAAALHDLSRMRPDAIERWGVHLLQNTDAQRLGTLAEGDRLLFLRSGNQEVRLAAIAALGGLDAPGRTPAAPEQPRPSPRAGGRS
jgi:hypothetical protein